MSYFIIVSPGIIIVTGVVVGVNEVEVSSTDTLAGVVSLPVKCCSVAVWFWQEIRDKSRSRRKYVIARR